MDRLRGARLIFSRLYFLAPCGCSFCSAIYSASPVRHVKHRICGNRAHIAHRRRVKRRLAGGGWRAAAGGRRLAAGAGCKAWRLSRRQPVSILPTAAEGSDEVDACAELQGVESQGLQLRLKQGGLRGHHGEVIGGALLVECHR
jgi:hypothetical protein